MAMKMRAPFRELLIIVGTTFTGLGVVGVFVPLLPTTPFLLLAAACYARSSARFYDWLLSSRLLGSYIKNYREGMGIPLRAKLLGITLLWLTIGASVAFVVQALVLRLILIMTASAVSAYIISVRTLRNREE